MLQIIRQRRSVKVISEQPLPSKKCDKGLINTLIESAYYAPFHYPCDHKYREHNNSPLPWRFYILDSQSCRQLVEIISNKNKIIGKIKQLLYSADYLIQATWCPQKQQNSNELFTGNLVNMEHIAGTGAAIQNLLLTATALGYESYWSSGEIFKENSIYKLLNIGEEEILLGSLFIFPNKDNTPKKTQYLLSKRHNKRGKLSDCYRFIKL